MALVVGNQPVDQKFGSCGGSGLGIWGETRPSFAPSQHLSYLLYSLDLARFPGQVGFVAFRFKWDWRSVPYSPLDLDEWRWMNNWTWRHYFENNWPSWASSVHLQIKLMQKEWLSGKEFACSAADIGHVGLIPGLAKAPGEGNGSPLQYSCLGNPMDRGGWWLQFMGSQRVRHDWALTHTHHEV